MNKITGASTQTPADRFTLLRALAHLETDDAVRCADHLAQCYLDPDWRDAMAYRTAILRRFETNAPGAYAYGLARTAYFDAQLREAIADGVRQVLVLGAGFDSRADRFPLEPPLTFFEFDRAAVHRTKAQRRSAAGLPPCANHVYAVPIDFSKGDLATLLAVMDYDLALPMLVLAEGLQYYLPPSFLHALLDFLAHRAIPGSRLVLDYAHPDLLELERGLYGGEALARFAQHSSEPFLCTSTPEQMASACAERGLALRDTMDRDVMCNAFLRKADGTLLGQPFGGFHFCCIEHGRTTMAQLVQPAPSGTPPSTPTMTPT